MKKVKYYNKTISAIILIVAGSLFLSYSCDLVDSIEDIKPFYQLTEEATFTDNIKTESVLNGVYTAWKAQYIHLFTAETMLLSGNYEPKGTGADLFENNVDVDNSYLSGYYKDYYSLIQRANYLIKAMQSNASIPGLSTTRRIEIEAEALMHRAMAHFFLLRSFGQFYDTDSNLGIVLQSEPLSGNNDNPRATVQACYDLILADLDYAMANAPSTATAGRLTRHAAKAMKAKVLLYLEDWIGAADLALEIINSEVYELETDFLDLYAGGYNSGEVIFAPISIYPLGISPAGSSSYPPGELLKQVTDKSVGEPSDGDMVSGEGFDPRFSYAHSSASLIPGVYNNKYPFPFRMNQQGGSPFILRLGEMYLIYAEAKARLATVVDTEALAKLNAIRLRAGLLNAEPATKAELLEAIRIEKQLELFGEFNEPWFDMVRYHILGDINISEIKSTITTNDQLILPFPTRALSGNGGLVQNPGYTL